jgi:hypothetical protein
MIVCLLLLSIIVVNHPAASSACCGTFNLFWILPAIVLHFNWSILWLGSPGIIRSFAAASNIVYTFSKLWSDVLAPALLAICSMWLHRNFMSLYIFQLGRRLSLYLRGPLWHGCSLSVFTMSLINWNSPGVKLLNGWIERLMWPTFHCTQQWYMPPFGNWKPFNSLLSSPRGFVCSKKASCVWGVLIRAHGCRVGLPLLEIDPSKVSTKSCSFCSKRSARCSTFLWHAVAIMSFIQASAGIILGPFCIAWLIPDRHSRFLFFIVDCWLLSLLWFLLMFLFHIIDDDTLVGNSCFWALSSLRATSTEVFAGQIVLFLYCICGCLLDWS